MYALDGAMNPSCAYLPAGTDQLTQPSEGRRIDAGPDGRGLLELPAHAEWQTSGRSVRSDIPKNDASCAPATARLLSGRAVQCAGFGQGVF